VAGVKRPLIRVTICKPDDARGWIGLGCYALVLVLLAMMWADKSLLRDDFFKVIATAIILTGWNQGPVGWAYQATKSGGEMAESSARIAEQAATAAVGAPIPRDAAEAAQVTAASAQSTADDIQAQAGEK
jgi:hypothetical protein